MCSHKKYELTYICFILICNVKKLQSELKKTTFINLLAIFYEKIFHDIVRCLHGLLLIILIFVT